MLIGADRVFHLQEPVDRSDSDEESELSSSSNASDIVLDDGEVNPTDSAADQSDQPRIWSTSTSEVRGTLEYFITNHKNSATHVQLLAVAQAVMTNGVIQLQEALEIYHSSGNRSQKNPSHFRDHLLRNLPLTAFAGARKRGWMLMERTDQYHSVLARLLQRIGKLQAKLGNLDRLSDEEYRKLEVLMDAQQRQISRYLLLQVFGVAEVRKRFGFTNIDVISTRVQEAQSKFDSSDFAQAAARKHSQKALQSARKGGRIPWEKKPEVACAVIDEVQHSVIVFLDYYFIKTEIHSILRSFF